MKPVRVIHVSPAHPPTDLRIVDKQAATLSAHYEVICLLPNARQHKAERMRFIHLPFFRWLGWRLLVVHPLILGHIIRLRPTVLHIYMPELLPIALLSRLLGVKVIYEVQENLRLKFDRKPYNKHLLFRWAFELFDRQARRYAYHIFTEESYLNTYTDLTLPHTVIHNYPDLAFVKSIKLTQPAGSLTLSNDGPHLLYVGVVSFDRGLDTMIQVVALLRPNYPHIRLHLFGRCTFSEADLQAIPNYTNVHNSLIFYGHTDAKTAYAHSARYSAGLALLKPVGDYPDSYPTKLFEYMALGIPVITSDFPLYRAVVLPANCGYCIAPTHAKQVADCLVQVFDAPSESRAMGQRGKLAVERTFNWQTETNQLLEFYEKVVLT